MPRYATSGTCADCAGQLPGQHAVPASSWTPYERCNHGTRIASRTWSWTDAHHGIPPFDPGHQHGRRPIVGGISKCIRDKGWSGKERKPVRWSSISMRLTIIFLRKENKVHKTQKEMVDRMKEEAKYIYRDSGGHRRWHIKEIFMDRECTALNTSEKMTSKYEMKMKENLKCWKSKTVWVIAIFS